MHVLLWTLGRRPSIGPNGIDRPHEFYLIILLAGSSTHYGFPPRRWLEKRSFMKNEMKYMTKVDSLFFVYSKLWKKKKNYVLSCRSRVSLNYYGSVREMCPSRVLRYVHIAKYEPQLPIQRRWAMNMKKRQKMKTQRWIGDQHCLFIICLHTFLLIGIGMSALVTDEIV